MKAIGYTKLGEIEAKDSLTEFETNIPELRPHDLLIEVKAISVNPVDVKVRMRATPEQNPKVIGYDAAGIVKETGSAVSHFKKGDEVYYAGDITRPGTNSEFHAVDERIVGKKPQSLSFTDAAALPLTSITAWELLFESLGVTENGGQGESLLIIGGAGGVGSILIQLAKKLTALNVIATASRPETVDWVKKMGADTIIDHGKPLNESMTELGIKPHYVASLTATEQHFPAIIDLIAPRGKIALIDDPQSIDIKLGKPKALSFSWEFMFTRSMFETEDMIKQQELLNRVSALIDSGDLITTANSHVGKISAQTLRQAHINQLGGKVIGKQVLEGF